MSWPASISMLLAMPDSGPAKALRWGLRGLEGTLRAALEETPDAAGGAQVRDLLGELEQLLGGVAPALPSDHPADSLPPEPAAPVSRLSGLARAVALDSRFAVNGKPSPISDGDDEAIWNDLQRLLLRVAPDLAREWQQRFLKEAVQLGCRADESRSVVLPLPREETIYPGIAGSVEAAGLRASCLAPSELPLAAGATEDLRLLAGLVATCFWFIEQDRSLCHCLKNVFRFGVTGLHGEQRERYVAELRRRWERVQVSSEARQQSPSQQALKEWLKDRLDLDEALHSLVYQPPAAPESWWGRLLNHGRQTLFWARDSAVQAGCSVHLQLLGGSFADISALAPDSLQVDFGIPGEISVCLRLWARIDGEELKGRVLYRSPEGQP
jgi:hypothetical protein